MRFARVLLLAFAAAGSEQASITPDHIAVICRCSVSAYQEALQGIREVLHRDPEVIDVDRMPGHNLAGIRQHDQSTVYIAIGLEAATTAAALRPDLPIVATMVLSSDAGLAGTAREIDLNVPPRILLREIKALLPHYLRIGLLFSNNLDRDSYSAAAADLGLELVSSEVNSPADLIKALSSFKGKVDVVLTLPDQSLYNSATVQALIVASLEARIPVIGFSAAFVHAGAAAGIFADFKDAGRQAAESALRLDPARVQHTAEQPRRVVVAVNQRIVRLLGIDYNSHADVAVVR